MPISTQTLHSPYVTIHSGATSHSAVTGVIVDRIQMVSDVPTNDATITLGMFHSPDTKVVKISSGDSISGPFTSYHITAADTPGCSFIVHERSRITTS